MRRTKAGKAWWVLALALFGLSLGGCPRLRGQPKGPKPTPAQLLAKAAAGTAAVQTVVGEAKVDYFDKDGGAAGRIKGKTLFIVQPPRGLRFDVLTPFDQPIAILSSNGERFALLTLSDGAFYEGTPTPENIGRLFQLSFADTDIIRGLLGQAPALLDPSSEEVSFDKKVGAWALTQEKDGLTQVLHFDTKTGYLVRATQLQGKKVVARISYENYEAVEGVDGVVLPREIFFEKPLEKSDLKIKVVGDIDVNTSPDPEVFTLQPPAGATVIPVN